MMTRIPENKVEKENAALLRLHKASLDDERTAFERARGRIKSSGEFLQLVLGHDKTPKLLSGG